MGEPASDYEGAPEPASPVYVPESGKVAIRDQDGSVWKIPQTQLGEAQFQGARPATEAEYFGAQQGKPGEVLAAGAGFARGGTLGLSDLAYVEGARALGGDVDADAIRKELRLLKESSPYASFGGEMGGGLALGAATGGAGGIARVAGEGAAMGLGAQLSEDTLENHAFNGEAYLRAGGLGLLTGAGLGVGAKMLGKVAPMFGRGAAHAEEGAASRLLTRAEEGGPYRAAVAHEAEAAAETAGGKSTLSRIEEMRDFATYKATGANRTDVKALGKTADDQLARMEEISGRLRGETFEGKALVEATASENEINRRINGRANEVGKDLGAMRAKLDETLERPSIGAIAKRFETEVAGPATALPGGDREIRGADRFLRDLETKGGEAPTFDFLYKSRRKLDDLAKYGPAVPKAETEAYRALRAIVEDEFTTAGERAAKSIGETFADDYRITKSLYSDLATARSASNRAVGRGMGNNVVSLRDIGAGITGVATAGPLGLAAAGVSMVGRRYGNQIAAHVLDKAVQMQSVQRAASTLDTLLNDGAKAFVSGKRVAAKTAKAASSEEIRALREATRSTDAVTARVAESLGDLPKYAPKVAQEAAIVAARAAAWLQHALPKDAPPVSMFGPQKPAPLSDTQRLKATATIEGVADPALVVERLNQGKLTPEHVAALRYVHPEAFAKIQGYLAQHQTEMNRTMTQQQLFKLSLLFGMPLTEAALPENVRALQASFTQGNQAPGSAGQGGNTGGSPAGMSAGPVMGGGTRTTAFDKLEQPQ